MQPSQAPSCAAPPMVFQRTQARPLVAVQPLPMPPPPPQPQPQPESVKLTKQPKVVKLSDVTAKEAKATAKMAPKQSKAASKSSSKPTVVVATAVTMMDTEDDRALLPTRFYEPRKDSETLAEWRSLPSAPYMSCDRAHERYHPATIRLITRRIPPESPTQQMGCENYEPVVTRVMSRLRPAVIPVPVGLRAHSDHNGRPFSVVDDQLDVDEALRFTLETNILPTLMAQALAMAMWCKPATSAIIQIPSRAHFEAIGRDLIHKNAHAECIEHAWRIFYSRWLPTGVHLEHPSPEAAPVAHCIATEMGLRLGRRSAQTTWEQEERAIMGDNEISYFIGDPTEVHIGAFHERIVEVCIKRAQLLLRAQQAAAAAATATAAAASTPMSV